MRKYRHRPSFWIALGAFSVFFAAWIVTERHRLYYQWGPYEIEAFRSYVTLKAGRANQGYSFCLRPLPALPQYGFDDDVSFVRVPLWMLWLPIGILGLVLRFRDRATPTGAMCARCGYDLRGNVSGRCPECGTVVERDRKKGQESEKGSEKGSGIGKRVRSG